MPLVDKTANPDGGEQSKKSSKLGIVSGVYIPVCLNILSILMFLRFGVILGRIGLLGILGLLVTSYSVNFLTTLSLSAIASNGEVKGGGAYYLISRSLGPEFGGSIGLLFYLSQVLNTALNVVGLIDCIRLNIGDTFPRGYWNGYGLETMALLGCTALCLAGSGLFAKASNGLLVVLTVAILSIPISAMFGRPFTDDDLGIEFTGMSMQTLRNNLVPHSEAAGFGGIATFRDLFGILFPATSGIFAGASMSGDLKNPSKAIPKGTLWAMLSTFIAYLVVIFSMAASTTHESFLRNANVIPATNLSPPVVFAGECAVTLFSALMGVIGSAKLLQALSRDRLLPGLSVFGKGSRVGDEPVAAIFLTYVIAQFALLADLNQIATFISMGYQITFFVMNLACFLLKIGSAPNFRPGFKVFNWQTALGGALMSAGAMFFIDETYAAAAICLVVFLFSLIHYLSPPKRWGDVSQNLIYHQVRKYLLRLRPEHIKFWRPQIILLINNPRRQTRLIQFCNSMKKGSLYILGHVIVTDDFNTGVQEAKLQQNAWTNYISEVPRLKAFVQLTMSPSINWGVRNLILSAGLGGMRPNIAVLGFYNMDELRRSRPPRTVPDAPSSPVARPGRPSSSDAKAKTKAVKRRRGDTSARILQGFLPTDVIRTEELMPATSYMTILEDLSLRHKLNVAVGKGFERLETPRKDGCNSKKYIDLWPIQMSAEIMSDGKSLLTTNFDTYTLILQLGFILSSVPAWKNSFELRVLVFVEYESEVEEEKARVKILLEKLRIEAEVHVFWLACGELKTYELIINGGCDDMDSEIMVNDILRDEEWWDELQRYRGRPASMSSSQELNSLAAILDATAGRPGVYNPHGGIDDGEPRRRPSVVDLDLLDLHGRPTVSRLSRLGVNVGIHTQHLADDVLDDTIHHMDSVDTDVDNSDGADSSLSSELDLESESDASDDETGHGGQEHVLGAQRPLLGRPRRRTTRTAKKRIDAKSETTAKSYGTMSTGMPANTQEPWAPSGASPSRHVGDGTAASQPQTPRTEQPTRSASAAPILEMRRAEQDADKTSLPAERPQVSGGGSVADMHPTVAASVSASGASHSFPDLVNPREPQENQHRLLPRSETASTAYPVRPSMSRQSSAIRFSSKVVPEPMTNVDDTSGPTIGFAGSTTDTPTASSRLERPGFSRQSSAGCFSSRPLPGTKITSDEAGPRISFADAPIRHHSRKSSTYSNFATPDATLNMPDISETYRSDTSGGDDGSPYSTQNFSLSFNDLPSRAQHIILNELMRKNSQDAAVVMSTLPIPAEGTNSSEEATLMYLSDIEVLCNELPPTLLVLSNSMTVTVGL